MSEPAPRQPSLPPMEPGTVLAGKYRVERIIGRGGMGVVVEARHIALDDRVALKFLLPEHAMREETAARFLYEARAAVKIKSEHVARVSDVGALESGAPYMVMELLVGQDLANLLQERGALPLEDAVDYIIQACEAIAEAHVYGIIHRDLKPANLFLTSRPDGSPLVKVLDFGISKLVHGVENLTRTGMAMGSALYMSPEQMHEARSVDHRTDIYALGVSLFELCAGRQPFYADGLPQLYVEILTGTPTPLRALRPDLPEAFGEALERAYARDRALRYASIPELVLALAPFAPPRSGPIIERIARMGGLSSPLPAAEAVDWPRPPMPSPVLGAGAITTPMPGLTSAASLPGSMTAAAPLPQPPILHVPSPPPFMPLPNALPRFDLGPAQIVPGPYSGPMSSRAAATFASSTGTGAGLPHPTRPFRLASLLAIAVMFAGALAVGVVVGWIALRGSGVESGPGPAGSATAAPPDPAPPPAWPPPPAGASAPEPPVRPAADTVAPPSSPAASSASPAAPTPASRGSGARSPQAQRPAPSPTPSKGLDLNNPN